MGASDSLRQKKIKFFCPILDTSTCMPTHLLLEYGKIGNESKDAAVPHGAFGHRRYHEHIHPFGVGGCERRDDSYGGTERCQEGIGKDHWGEACDSEDVQSSIERILI